MANKKTRKKVEKIIQTNKASADLVSSIIYNMRIKLGHRAVKKITEKDQGWNKIKELANTCSIFCESFDLSIREGCIEYIKMGLERLHTYNNYLIKLIDMYDVICEEYESIKAMKEGDNNIAHATMIHDIYSAEVLNRVGLNINYSQKPQEFIHFANAAKICDELGCDYELYIEAQISGLEWTRSIPTPSQLDNQKSYERLIKYLAENNIKLSTKSEKVDRKSFWDNLKSTGDE